MVEVCCWGCVLDLWRLAASGHRGSGAAAAEAGGEEEAGYWGLATDVRVVAAASGRRGDLGLNDPPGCPVWNAFRR